MKYLSRGVKVPRFRKTNKQIKNRVLYAILLSKDIKISKFASLIGVVPRTIQGWIVSGSVPNGENLKLVCEVLKYPQHILFNPDVLKDSPIICVPNKSKYHKNVTSRSGVKNEIIHGLLILHDISITDAAVWCDLHPGTLRKYVHCNHLPQEDFQLKLSDFFRISQSILFYNVIVQK